MKSVEILISGKVQRVGYRACVRRIATDLHVTGTVVNLPDGRVRIHASAEPMILEKFVSMIYSLSQGSDPGYKNFRNSRHDLY